jgi:membrane fusion protein (multidrug efflux system)
VVLDIDTGHARGLPSFVSWSFGKSEPRHG